MTCKSCAERRIAAKRMLAKILGIEWVDSNPPANMVTDGQRNTERTEADGITDEPAAVRDSAGTAGDDIPAGSGRTRKQSKRNAG